MYKSLSWCVKLFKLYFRIKKVVFFVLFLRKIITFFPHTFLFIYALVKCVVRIFPIIFVGFYVICVVFNLKMRGPSGSALYACVSVLHANVDFFNNKTLMKLRFFDFRKCDSQFVFITLLCILTSMVGAAFFPLSVIQCH